MTIHSLRPQARPDNARNQIRAGQTMARRLYLALLLSMVGWIAYLFVGPLVVIDADGLVLQDREAVMPPYSAQVLSLAIRPGQVVEAGDQLATVVSTQMLDLISDLTTRTAKSESRMKQIEARLSAIRDTAPIAERRLRATATVAESVSMALSRGFSTSVRVAEATRDKYDAAREVAALRAEQSALEAEASALRANGARLADALEKAKATYHDGVVTSPVSGVVGPKTVDPGVVLRPGDPIADIYHGRKYVLAYLPTNRLYGVSPGREVVVTDGTNRETGRIERVESFAAQVPPEFQNGLRGVDRQQVARVELANTGALPLLTKIKVTDPRAPSNILAEGEKVVAQAAQRIGSLALDKAYAFGGGR